MSWQSSALSPPSSGPGRGINGPSDDSSLTVELPPADALSEFLTHRIYDSHKVVVV